MIKMNLENLLKISDESDSLLYAITEYEDIKYTISENEINASEMIQAYIKKHMKYFQIIMIIFHNNMPESVTYEIIEDNNEYKKILITES